jgi:hypothetical protein
MATKSNIALQTIAHLKAQGVTGACPFCRSCGHSGAVLFEAMGLPDATPFPAISRARRFRCLSCGARDCAVMPDWSSYRASRMGRWAC